MAFGHAFGCSYQDHWYLCLSPSSSQLQSSRTMPWFTGHDSGKHRGWHLPASRSIVSASSFSRRSGSCSANWSVTPWPKLNMIEVGKICNVRLAYCVCIFCFLLLAIYEYEHLCCSPLAHVPTGFMRMDFWWFLQIHACIITHHLKDPVSWGWLWKQTLLGFRGKACCMSPECRESPCEWRPLFWENGGYYWGVPHVCQKHHKWGRNTPRTR